MSEFVAQGPHSSGYILNTERIFFAGKILVLHHFNRNVFEATVNGSDGNNKTGFKPCTFQDFSKRRNYGIWVHIEYKEECETLARQTHGRAK